MHHHGRARSSRSLHWILPSTTGQLHSLLPLLPVSSSAVTNAISPATRRGLFHVTIKSVKLASPPATFSIADSANAGPCSAALSLPWAAASTVSVTFRSSKKHERETQSLYTPGE